MSDNKLHVEVSSDAYAWIQEQTKELGVCESQIVDMLVHSFKEYAALKNI